MYQVQRTWAYLFSSVHTRSTHSFRFIIAIRHRYKHKQEHKPNLKLHSNNTALLVAPLFSAQSLPNSLSGKDTVIQTLRPTHRLDLRLVDVLGGGTAE